jgi:hypothetical protein
MHLIVLTDAAQGRAQAMADGARPDPQALLVRWSPLMLRLVPGWGLTDTPEALNTLAERARAQLFLGRAMGTNEDGCLPLQAWSQDGSDAGSAPCARLTPFHGLVGSDRITLVPPAELNLSEEESRALFASVRPLFDSEGVAMQWRSPLNWDVAHDSLRQLPCASLARAEGDSVQRWQVRTPLGRARLLRRLQNEAQMVLHEHPVNGQRAERGELTVNSLWLDHAGCADQLGGGRCAAHHIPVQLTAWAHADTALQAWVDAALRAPVKPHGTGTEPTLVLCGRYQAQSFSMRRLPGGWRGAIARTIMRPPRTEPLSAWLKTLDHPPIEPDV